MELELIQKIDVAKNPDIQYHRLTVLKSRTVVAFYSDDNEGCYYLDWYTDSGVEHIWTADFTYDVFDRPTLFQFSDYVGLYASSGNILSSFTEEEKTQPVKISISNTIDGYKW